MHVGFLSKTTGLWDQSHDMGISATKEWPHSVIIWHWYFSAMECPHSMKKGIAIDLNCWNIEIIFCDFIKHRKIIYQMHIHYFLAIILAFLAG